MEEVEQHREEERDEERVEKERDEDDDVAFDFDDITEPLEPTDIDVLKKTCRQMSRR